MPRKYAKGKAWRRDQHPDAALKAALKKKQAEREKIDPNLSNKQRMEMRKAARVYRETGGL